MDEKQTQDRTPAGGQGEPIAWPQYVYPYRSGVIGGLIGGAVMALIAVVTAPLIQHSIWFPLNLVAAAVLDLQEATLDQFTLDAFVTGSAIHITVSVSIGLIFALLLPTLPGPPLVWSVVIGAIMWFVALFLALPILNPLMEQYVQPVSFVIAQISYTLTLGWWISRSEKVRTG